MAALWSLSRGRGRSAPRPAPLGADAAEDAAPTQAIALALTGPGRDRARPRPSGGRGDGPHRLPPGPVGTCGARFTPFRASPSCSRSTPARTRSARGRRRPCARWRAPPPNWPDAWTRRGPAPTPIDRCPPAVPRRVDLRLAARLACDGLHGRAQAAGVELECGPPTAGLCALADPQRLQAALRALIDDALRHAAPGEVVRLDVERRGDRIQLTRTTRTPPGRPRSLTDAVDAEGRLRPGLGLGAVQRLAESMGGTLEPSRAAPGPTLRLSLPAAEAALPRPRIRLALYAGSGPAESPCCATPPSAWTSACRWPRRPRRP
ncbi:hypothetical protein MU852_08850 [Brevundimonas albigilva]|uniref:sensor histidine kinase n=1 Tax=Brevundimonas albigilva TaxID=1312364 RepID=UPI00201B8BA6|nr:ATP-binding protein [Brevundimonas albigilva]UQV17097.1 hypothetical protein MU852_08850 [Brevundimonas albigilva]